MSMSFAITIGLLFALVFALESATHPAGAGIRPHSLLRWVSSDNWPAKVGAILIIIGVGALLRYAMLHLDAPDHLKLGGGVALSALTGLAAYACRQHPARRALHFALTGAAFGIAYLCAYASFGLFSYLDDLSGIALLLTVALGAAAYAANSNAVSIAVLSMVGAYAAPAFAVSPKGPLLVLGYYALVSLLALVLVVVRSWRPLIHLSFLFTLGGALFFGWTQAYYRPEHFAVMLPLLLVLVAIHLAMPLAERHAVRAGWLVRLDSIYQLLLPITAAVLMCSIAPRLDPDAALGLGLLGGLWLIAAGVAWRIRREVFAAHAMIGALLVLGGLLIHFQHLSWPLLGVIGGTFYLIAATRFSVVGGSPSLLGAFVLICYLLFVLDGHRFPPGSEPFMNIALAENLIVAACLLASGATLQRRGGLLGTTLLLAGGLWGSIVLMSELLRLHIPQLPQLVHGAVIVTTVALALTPGSGARRDQALRIATLLVVLTAWWAARANPSPALAVGLAVGALAALWLLFHRRLKAGDASRQAFPSEAFALPVVALFWADALNRVLGVSSIHFVFALLAATLLVTVLLARRHAWRQAAFNDFLLPVIFIGGALLLFFTYLSHIERGSWPVIAELLGLALLAAIALGIPEREQARLPMVTLAVLFALMLQAQVLRLFGPPGTLSLADLARLSWPAVVSLLWVVMGATLAWASQRLASRAVWSAGALLLAISAVKLILFDFGSLGELENILALIAAGGVFMGVAWIAPLPPKGDAETRQEPPPGAADSR